MINNQLLFATLNSCDNKYEIGYDFKIITCSLRDKLTLVQ